MPVQGTNWNSTWYRPWILLAIGGNAAKTFGLHNSLNGSTKCCSMGENDLKQVRDLNVNNRGYRQMGNGVVIIMF